MRRCIGCRTSYPQEDLIRFTFDGSSVIADEGGKREGRGFYLCRNEECLAAAIKAKAFNRICRTNVDTDSISAAFRVLKEKTEEDKDVEKN